MNLTYVNSHLDWLFQIYQNLHRNKRISTPSTSPHYEETFKKLYIKKYDNTNKLRDISEKQKNAE